MLASHTGDVYKRQVCTPFIGSLCGKLLTGTNTPFAISSARDVYKRQIIGGNLVVDNATLIAKAFGMSQTLIGLTIVAIGTSCLLYTSRCV